MAKNLPNKLRKPMAENCQKGPSPMAHWQIEGRKMIDKVREIALKVLYEEFNKERK